MWRHDQCLPVRTGCKVLGFKTFICIIRHQPIPLSYRSSTGWRGPERSLQPFINQPPKGHKLQKKSWWELPKKIQTVLLIYVISALHVLDCPKSSHHYTEKIVLIKTKLRNQNNVVVFIVVHSHACLYTNIIAWQSR